LIFFIGLFLFSCSKKLQEEPKDMEMTSQPSQTSQVAGDYNYFFKVIVPEEKKLTKSEETMLNSSIQKLTDIFNQRVTKSRNSFKNSENSLEMPAFTAAAIFADYEKIGEVVKELNEQDSAVLFSHDDLFINNCIVPEDSKSKGISKEFVVYKYDNLNGIVKYSETRNVIVSKTEETNSENENQIKGFVLKDEELYQNFANEMVNQLTLMPDLNIASSENSDNLVIKSDLLEMTVEYETNTDTNSETGNTKSNIKKGFWKKIRKAATKVWSAVKKPVAVIGYAWSGVSCVFGNVYGCANFAVSSMMLLAGYPLWDQPTILFLPMTI